MIQFIVVAVCIALVFASILLVVASERKKNRSAPFVEKTLRSPGYSLSQKIDLLTNEALDVLLVLFIIPAIDLFAYSTLQPGFWLAVILIASVIIFLFLLSKLTTLYKKIRDFRLGLDGEIYTGQELNYLMREGAWVYHDIPYKYGNIDHIVVSKGGIYCIETKSVRKPHDEKGKKEVRVKVADNSIIFPHMRTKEPVTQAQTHVEHLSKHLLNKTGVEFPVFPVIALPGWYVDIDETKKRGFYVMNPKRGSFLSKYLKDERIPKDKLTLANRIIESDARDVQSNADMTDPNGRKKYSFFLKRKKSDAKF